MTSNPTPSKDEEIKRLTSERDEALRLLKVCAELIHELPKGPIASVIADMGLHGLRESIARLESGNHNG